MKTVLSMLFLCACLTAGAQAIEIHGPYGTAPDAVFFVAWEHLAGMRRHSNTARTW